MEDNEKDVETLEQQRHLPHDLITHHILTRLPIETLLPFKSVSKQWYSSLSFDRRFADAHFKSSPFSDPSSPIQFVFIQAGYNYYLYSYDDDEIDSCSQRNLVKLAIDFGTGYHKLLLIGSCNGLVCLASSSGNYFILWNPITRQFHKYYSGNSERVISSRKSKCRVSWGFGYVLSVDDFKVVRIVEYPLTRETMVHVFSLKSNSWTRIANELYEHVFSLRTTGNYVLEFVQNETVRYPVSFNTTRGVLVNGILYWIVAKTQEQGRNVVAFDLALEKFETFPHMDLRSDFVYRDDFLCVMGGCLSKCGVNMRDDVNIDILERPGKKESIRLFRDMELCARKDFIGFTKTGKFFVLLGTTAGVLELVDPSSKPMKYTRLLKFEERGITHIASYVPSLISPFPIADLQEA